MRTTWTILRHSAILALAPIVVGLAVAAAGAQRPTWEGDWASASSHAVTTIAVIAPLAAGIAAWEAGRARRAGFDGLRSSMPRSTLAHASIIVGGLTLACLVAYGVALAVVAADVLGGGSPISAVIGFGAAALLTFNAVGYAIGTYVSRFVAAPLTIVVTYAWLVFIPDAGTAWIRRVSPVPTTCCALNRTVADSVAGAEFAWLALLVIAAAWAVSASPRVSASTRISRLPPWRELSAAVLPTAAGVAAGISLLVASGGVLSVPSRPPSDPACGSRNAVTVCLWPAHRYQLAPALAAAAATYNAFPGVAVPRKFYESGLAVPPGSRAVTINVPAQHTSPAQLATTFAQDLLPQPPPCARVQTGPVQYPAAVAMPLVQAWVQERVAAQPIPVSALVPPRMAPDLKSLLDAPWPQQRQWFLAATMALHGCSRPAPPVPS